MANFLQNLRMANLGNPFDPGRGESPLHLLDQFRRRLPNMGFSNPQGNLQNIGRRIVQPQQDEPMNVVYQPSISEQIGQKRIADIVHPDPELAMKKDLFESQMGMKQSELGIKQQRANVYKYKAEHPGSQYFQGKDGILRAVDKSTNEVTELGPTGMSDEELANLNQENALERIGAQGEQGINRERVRGEEERKTKVIPPGKASTEEKPLLPTQQKTARQMRAQEAWDTHPEWRKALKVSDTGFQISAPGMTRFGADQATIDAVKNFIYGNEPSGNEISKKAETKSTTKTEDKRVKVTGPNGKTGTVLESESKSLPTGWSVVK